MEPSPTIIKSVIGKSHKFSEPYMNMTLASSPAVPFLLFYQESCSEYLMSSRFKSILA